MKFHTNPLLCVAAFFAAVSCQCGRGGAVSSDAAPSVSGMEYARYLTISENDSCTIVDILNPWREGSLLHRYVLVSRDEAVKSWPEGTVIKVPVERMVIYTGVHACMMEEIGCIGQIKGVCEPEYIFSPVIKELAAIGIIANLGDAYTPDIEKIIALEPDVIITSPFENSGYGAAEKLGIPIVEAADYMENLPLGRTEWVKFFGLLTGRAATADSIFRSTEARYREYCRKAASVSDEKPSVIAERKYGASWGVAGRDSYMSALYRDAGGRYLFDDVPGTGSTRMSFEKVLERGIHADVWLIKYASDSPFTYDELLSEYPPYSGFDAFRKKQVYACNTLKSPYYRDITLHPDFVLEDLIHIFHPSVPEENPGRVRYFLRIP